MSKFVMYQIAFQGQYSNETMDINNFEISIIGTSAVFKTLWYKILVLN